MKREACTPLREYQSAVKKMVAKNVPDNRAAFMEVVAVWKFCNTLGHTGLQPHLPGMILCTVEEAIVSGEGYLEVRNNQPANMGDA